jgi:hypothetical protein
MSSKDDFWSYHSFKILDESLFHLFQTILTEYTQCSFWKWIFSRASTTPLSQMQTSPHETPSVVFVVAIPPMRFGDSANQLGGIAQICKSSDAAPEVLRFQNSFFRGALKTRLSKMQYLWDEMLDISCFCNTSHTKTTILTCQALRRGPFPPPKWWY